MKAKRKRASVTAGPKRVLADHDSIASKVGAAGQLKTSPCNLKIQERDKRSKKMNSKTTPETPLPITETVAVVLRADGDVAVDLGRRPLGGLEYHYDYVYQDVVALATRTKTFLRVNHFHRMPDATRVSGVRMDPVWDTQTEYAVTEKYRVGRGGKLIEIACPCKEML